MPTVLLIIGAVILAVVAAMLIVWRIRSHRFRPDSDTIRQQRELNTELKETGFAYELKGDYFYSLMNCWQRQVGYCRLYDDAAPLFNMIMDCEPITFSYGGKRWLIELWKGQYGITTGGEIGVYNTVRDDMNTDKFKGTFYENIRNDEMLNLSFVLRRNGKTILKRSAVHWWLTGFKLGQFSDTDMLTMDAKIMFPDQGMKEAFLNALTEIGYTKKEYSSGKRSVSIHYAVPHSPQPQSRAKAAEIIVQQTNSNNCKLYELATAKYSQTLDKLQYIKAMVPELYKLFIDSLYARGVYDAFDWIKEWLEGRPHKPNPQPVPPCPPEPPKPPVLPCPPEPPRPPVDPCPPKPPVPPCPPCRPDRQGCRDCHNYNCDNNCEHGRSHCHDRDDCNCRNRHGRCNCGYENGKCRCGHGDCNRSYDEQADPYDSDHYWDKESLSEDDLYDNTRRQGR